MTTLNIRCCCDPGRVLGTVDLPTAPAGEGEISTEYGILQLRQYYEMRDDGYHTELAVVGHESSESA